jgi:hypothetical protein
LRLLDDPMITTLASLPNTLLMATTVPIGGRALQSRYERLMSSCKQFFETREGKI